MNYNPLDDTHGKPIPIAGRFGIIQRGNSLHPSSFWAIAEIVGPTGLWIHRGYFHDKDSAITAAWKKAAAENPSLLQLKGEGKNTTLKDGEQ